MFLKHTYQYSKWLFTIIVCFAAGQAIINYKHGAVVSPLYHYGMYSGVFKVQDRYDIILIEANGQFLRGQDFTIHEWDKIYLPVQYYLAADSNNNEIINVRNRAYTLLRLNRLKEINDLFMNPHLSPLQFMSWYHAYLEKITKYPIASLAIKKMQFKAASPILKPINQDSAKPILPVWYSANNISTK